MAAPPGGAELPRLFQHKLLTVEGTATGPAVAASQPMAVPGGGRGGGGSGGEASTTTTGGGFLPVPQPLRSMSPNTSFHMSDGHPSSSEEFHLCLLSGTAHPRLSELIAADMSASLRECDLRRFADGEISVAIGSNVRGHDVFLLQPTCPAGDVNANLMELLLMIHTARLSCAARITAVVPYFGYARQDRKLQSRVPISGTVVAQLMETMGACHIITVDLHSPQLVGFFHAAPVDQLYAEVEFVREVLCRRFAVKDLVLIARKAGAVPRVTRVADELQCGIATVIKRDIPASAAAAAATASTAAVAVLGSSPLTSTTTTSSASSSSASASSSSAAPPASPYRPGHNRHRSGNPMLGHTRKRLFQLVGDVAGKTAFILDDIIASADALTQTAQLLKDAGAARVLVFATHGLFTGAAMERIERSCLEEVWVTNSCPQHEHLKRCDRLRVVDISHLLSEAIRRLHEEESISPLLPPSLRVV